MRPIDLPAPQWDIFCRVIDNFGDIGVSWRLARILAEDYGQSVRLWVDNPRPLAQLEPLFFSAEPHACAPHVYPNIELIHWTTSAPQVPPAPFVIEAFGCDLPEYYQSLMPGRTVAWFNLEYFSAETWVTGCHGLKSPTAHGLKKQFVFPSTLPNTGGLLRESSLNAARDQFIRDANAREQWAKHWNIPLPQGLSILLFGYENAALAPLLHALQAQPAQPVTVYVPEGHLLNSLGTALNRPTLAVGDTLQHHNITVHIVPFLPQTEFDRLLWLCDINFVRGEDSLVRALWAGKPLIWQIYPTEDNAHWAKLDALLASISTDSISTDSINPGLSPTSVQAWQRMSQAWNQQWLTIDDWAQFAYALPELSLHAEHTRLRLVARTELTSWLVKTAFERLQCATK